MRESLFAHQRLEGYCADCASTSNYSVTARSPPDTCHFLEDMIFVSEFSFPACMHSFAVPRPESSPAFTPTTKIYSPSSLPTNQECILKQKSHSLHTHTPTHAHAPQKHSSAMIRGRSRCEAQRNPHFEMPHGSFLACRGERALVHVHGLEETTTRQAETLMHV